MYSKSKHCSFQDVQVTDFNCYFSEIRQVSHSSLHQKALSKIQINNCFVCAEGEELFIISRGGTRFHLPLDLPVSRVFPMAEGVLIEFFIKAEVKLHEILHFQKHKNNMDVEDNMEGNFQQKQKGKYCYATLSRHPYNPLKVLGEFTNDELVPWLRVKESVVWVSDRVPLLVSYNEQLNRHAFHVLLGNVAQVKKEYQFAFVPTFSYSLKTLVEFPHHEILTQTVFQQTSSSEKLLNVILTDSPKRGHVLLHLQTPSSLKIYELDFYGSYTSTKLIKKVKDPICMIECDLYSKRTFKPQNFQFYQGENQWLMEDILRESIGELAECVAVVNENYVCFYKGGQMVATDTRISKYLMPFRAQDNKLYDSSNNQFLITPLISNSIDSLILQTLQQTIDDQHTFHNCLKLYCSGSSLIECIIKMYEIKPIVFHILHILYQEFKLYELMRAEREKIAGVIIALCCRFGRKEYLDYYLREGYTVNYDEKNNKLESLQHEEVYDIFIILSKILNNNALNSKPLHSIYNRSNFLLSFFQLLVFGQVQMPINPLCMSVQPHTKFSHGKQNFYRMKFPLLSQKVFHLDYYGQLYEDTLMCGINRQNRIEKAFIYLIKNQVSQSEIVTYPRAIRVVFNWLLWQMRRQLPCSLYQSIPKLGFDLIQRQDLYKNILLYKKKSVSTPYHLQQPSLDDHIKTLVHTTTSQQYFLTSNASEMNKINNDLIFEQVERLLSSSSEIKIKVKDIETIPEDKWEVQSQNILLKFANRKLAVIVGQGAFNLGISRSFITDVIKMPKINLSGIMPNDMKISLDIKEDKENIIHWPEFHSGMAAGLKLSRHVIPLSEDHLKTWIFYQKPDTPKRDHSGFLLSLGLLGYLKCFSPTDIYQYLKPNNEFTSVAILLGVSASNIGRSDQALSKTLVLHIPVLLPPTIDIEIPINVQTSALIGIGLLHKGTCNRTMTQMTLSQIGKRPSTDKCMDRQGYSLAAGWALGMICLGMRNKQETFRDLQLEERLIRFIEGGKVIEPPQSMISTNYVNQCKSSSIKEGSNVNLHITAPSALLAISLMYLKSNNQELAQRITIPNSFNTIEECNPNHILLKTIAKNLIMWDSISNSKEFMMGQIPEMIKFIYENNVNRVYQRYYLVYNVSEIDYQTISNIYLSVLTGSIIAMSFKYAGTSNQAVVKLIKEHIEHLKTVKITKCQFANDPLNKNSIDQYELFSLISSTILALAVVMAGTCDVDCLRLIRIIRKKYQDAKVFHYGFSIAISMAIGFIFLGYGNYTFNRQDMSIAALLIAIYPQFPNSPSDNKWHLQALRHFYVLAMQQKIFHAVDVDTNKVVNVAARMSFKVESETLTEEVHTPVLLQQSKKLTHIKIIDEDYFDVDFSFEGTRSEPRAIYIKRKHFKDINPQILNQQNNLKTEISERKVLETLQKQKRFNTLIDISKPKQSAISYLLPGISQQKQKQISSRIQQTNEVKDLYFRLLKQDKLEMLQIYLSLQRELKCLLAEQSKDHLLVSNIALLLNVQKWLQTSQFKTVIESDLTMLQKNLLSENQIKRYLLDPHETKLAKTSLYKGLKILQAPPSRDLIIIKNAISLMKKKKSQSNENIEMMLSMTYPECSFDIIKFLMEVYAK